MIAVDIHILSRRVMCVSILALLFVVSECAHGAAGDGVEPAIRRMRVVDIDGKPIVGAKVYGFDPDLAPAGLRISLLQLLSAPPELRFSEVHAPENPTAELAAGSSEVEGHFSFTNQPDRLIVIVVSEAGCTIQRLGEVRESIRVQPWAGVTGKALKAEKAAAKATISCTTTWTFSKDHPPLALYEATQADEEGKFRFERVVAGTTSVACVHTIVKGVYLLSELSHRARVETAAGKFRAVQLGGAGVRVSAQLRAEAGIRWDFGVGRLIENDPNGPLNAARYFAEVAANGAIRALDVPAGEYELHVDVYEQGVDNIVRRIGAVQHTIAVSKDDAEAGRVVDAGEVPLRRGD